MIHGVVFCPSLTSQLKIRCISLKNKAKFVGEEKNGRGRFFRRIWCRLHRLPLDVEEIKERPKKKKSKEKLNPSKIDKSSKVKKKKKIK